MNYLPLLGVMIMALSIHGKSLRENVDALTAVSSGANNFGIQFNKAIAKEKSGNYISSPYSVDVSFAMLYFGAEGNTKSQLQQSLRLSNDENIVKNGYQAAIDVLNSTQGVELSIANKIFTHNGFEVKDEFKEITSTYFRSDSESLDLTDGNAAAERINNWAAAHTKNRIQELFRPDDFNADTRLVMANAVYFKSKWAIPFDSSLTEPQAFHVDESTTKNVDTMHRRGDYNYGVLDNLKARYIELQYENDDVSMFVFIPDEINGLAAIEEKFSDIDLSKLNNRKARAYLWLPKFKIESKVDLKSILKKLNIEDIFENTANFHGINDSVPLKVSKVLQKSFIEVNEEGSESAAVTGIQSETFSAPVLFKVDKPFAFAIYSKKVGVNIFTGRVVDPTLLQ